MAVVILHRVGGIVARHRELALALAFVATAGWELFEFATLEAPHVASGPLTALLHSLQVAIVLAVTWVVGSAWQERLRHQEALARMMETVVMAQEDERRRIGYDIHDGIAQLIVSAKQHLDTSRAIAGGDPARASDELDRAADRLRLAIAETRRVLHALRPSAVESIGLVPAMRCALDEAAREAGWSTRFVDRVGEARVPSSVETAAFRILQESLVNALRHGRPTTVEVEVSRGDRWLRLDVRDDGIGFDHDGGGVQRGLGLAGMRERARLLGGTCRIDSRRAQGTSISVDLPLGPETRAGNGR
jgi:signal transduction histidine kinase